MKLAKELRQKKRGQLSVPVSFEDTAEAPVKKKKIRKGTTADFSVSGLGMFSDIELDPDTVLELECRDMWDAPKKFSVKWCSRVTTNCYRIGLEVKDED